MSTTELTYGRIPGSLDLRNEIAAFLGHNDPDRVLVTNGAIGANFLTVFTLVNPGDHVICVHPTYQQLYSLPESLGAQVDLLYLRKEDGYTPCLETLTSLITSKTKLIILNNPNNPTGATIPRQKLEKIVALAQEHDIYILSDEFYRPLFHSTESPPSVIELYPTKGLVTGSLSKAFLLAGIRVGFLSACPEFIRAAERRRDYNMISVSILDDAVATYALQHKDAI